MLFPTPFVTETYFSLLCIHGTLVKATYIWLYFWFLYSVTYVYISAFMLATYCLIYHSFVIYFEIRKCDASIFFSYLKIALSILYCSWIWNIFSFSWLQMMLTLGLAYIIWGSFPVFPLPLKFLNGYWILAKAFSTSSEMIVWFLFFSLLMCCTTLICRYWRIFAFGGKSHLDHGVWSF